MLAAGAIALAAVGAVYGWRDVHRGLPQGPLMQFDPGSATPGIDGPNIPFIFGAVFLFNTGTQPAYLDSARILNASPTMHQDAVYVWRVTNSGPVPIGFDSHWPRNAAAFHFKPIGAIPVLPDPKHGERHTFVDLAFKLSLTRPGRGTFDRIQVDYHVGSHHYRIIYPFALAACWPHTMHCRAEPLPD